MLKKLLIALLALVMLLQCGCGTTTETETEVDVDSETETETEGEGELEDKPQLYPDGLDVLLAGSANEKSENIMIKVKEDAYVVNGVSSANDSLNKVFGAEDVLEFKSNKGTTLHRIIYLKFDISSLPNSDFSGIVLQLDCKSSEVTTGTEVFVYECDPNEWFEDEITFSNRPARGKRITSINNASKGIISIDLTNYVKEAFDAGKDEISLILEGTDTGTPRRLTIHSKESKGGTAPMLNVQYGASFTTKLEYLPTIINPWSYAMACVNNFVERWDTVLAETGTDEKVELIPNNPKEYTLTVGATNASNTNGAATKYTNYATRTIDTLIDYTYNNNEKDLYDSYGGYMGGERYEATGYFYTKKIDGRWWAIDPLGYPYYHVGVVTISRGNATAKAAAEAKYGTADKWALTQTRHLIDNLGFNSCGGWSDIASLSKVQDPLSQTMILYMMSGYASQLGLNISDGGNTELVGGILPVFDPGFVTYCQDNAKSKISKYVDDPNVFGWMLDNELPGGKNMLDSSMGLDPTNSKFFYSYATAWTFMYVMNGNDPNVSLSDVTDELRELYRAMVWDRYFEVTTTAVREVDPNHMVLGARLVGGTYTVETIMRACAYWCDVITANVYNQWTPSSDWIADVERWTDAPFMVTEWYAKGMDVANEQTGLTNKSGAGFTVRTQKDRGLFYQNYALKLMEAKNCVGFDWFKYLDNDPTDLSADLSNRDSNKGIYTIYHEEYTAVTDLMKVLNFNKYSLVQFFDER